MRIAIALVLSPAVAHAEPCADARAASIECSAIDKPGSMSISSGWRSEPFDAAAHTFDVTRRGYVNTIGSFDGKNLAPIRANGFYIDVRLHPASWWYVGVDLAAAWADAPPMQFTTRGGEMIDWTGAAVATMAGLAGVRVPIGRLSLRGELVAGLHGGMLHSADVAGEADAALVAPRIAIDAWFQRWWVIEAFAGVNLLDRSEQSFGLALGFHSQAFDGHY